jgi:AraC-like DNA-binding protein
LNDTHDVRTLSVTYYDGYHVGTHRHDWSQLVYARSGMIQLLADGRIWFVPPTRAIWIPADTEHQFSIKGEVAFRTLYVSRQRSRDVKLGLGALEVSPLLGELILHILSHQILDPQVPSEDRLAGVLVDLLNTASSIDYMLPLPGDPRARRLADWFRAHPEDRTDLLALAAQTGASVRTLQRCFVVGTGMGVDGWRQKARLIASTKLLLDGCSVNCAAFDSGYESPSAYIAAFKRQFGVTPRQFPKICST